MIGVTRAEVLEYFAGAVDRVARGLQQSGFEVRAEPDPA